MTVAAMRGFVDKHGEIWAWPTLLWDHSDALGKMDYLRDHRARWRQWEPGGRVDFDREPLASDEDKAAVQAFLGLVPAVNQEQQ